MKIQSKMLALAIGWLRLITHMRSRSPASRHLSEQGVPMSRLKIFEKWPE